MGTIVSLISTIISINITDKPKIGFAIFAILIPQERITVISELRQSLFIVITVENRQLIGIVITITEGRFKIIIIIAILNGIP